MTAATWMAFVATIVVVALYPGVGTLFIVGTGLRHGVIRSLAAVMGMQTALLAYATLVGFGLAAVLGSSPVIFGLSKWAGVLYLLWMGVQTWRSGNHLATAAQGPADGSLFLRGFLVNFTNPKAIVFMAALFPQFIVPAQPVAPQLAVLALTMFVIDTVVMSSYAWLGSRLLNWMNSDRHMKTASRVSASLLMGAALWLATWQR